MQVSDIFARALNSGQPSRKGEAGPWQLNLLKLNGLTVEEFRFLYEIDWLDYVDKKVYTTSHGGQNRLCWMVEEIFVGASPEESYIIFSS